MSGISNQYGPFQSPDVFQYTVGFMELADVARSARVCKTWNQLIQTANQDLWKKITENEGIPLVTPSDGKPRDYKKDLQVLFPITISGRKISLFFGKMIGQVPPIGEKWFNKLEEEDPFEKGKLIKENYVFVVIPSVVKRTVDENTPLSMDESGNLIELNKESDKQNNWTYASVIWNYMGYSKQDDEQNNLTETKIVEKRDLMIPFSLKNHWILCSYPLKGKVNMPVFDKFNYETEVFDQCDTCPDKVGVYFMRKQKVMETRKMSHAAQDTLLQNQGFEVTPLRERALFDSVVILQSGTCDDFYKPEPFVRNSDTVNYNHQVCHSIIGRFIPGTGLVVYCDKSNRGNFCVVPGVSGKNLQS